MDPKPPPSPHRLNYRPPGGNFVYDETGQQFAGGFLFMLGALLLTVPFVSNGFSLMLCVITMVILVAVVTVIVHVKYHWHLFGFGVLAGFIVSCALPLVLYFWLTR